VRGKADGAFGVGKPEAAAERRRIIQKLLKKPPEGEGRFAGKGEKGEERRRRAIPGTDEPPPTEWLRAGGRGSMLAPVGADLEEAREYAMKRALEQHFNWMIINGLDPLSSHAGDCGCSMSCLFQN